MSLHRRADEEADIDPTDARETWEYIVEAEEHFAGDLCERCGRKHDEPPERCPTCNVTHLKATA